MKRIAPAFLFIALVVLAVSLVWRVAEHAPLQIGPPPENKATLTAQAEPTTHPDLEVFFSPKGGCTDAIVRELNGAKSSIFVQAYSFTSAPIAKALVAANNKRDVMVKVVLDKSQRTEKYSEADFLAHERVMVFIDAKHAIAHNKIMIIDRHTVITGSFNFTKEAEEHNAENLLIIRDKDLAKKYLANWVKHFDHSEEYEPR